jgi:hypothetical protein
VHKARVDRRPLPHEPLNDEDIVAVDADTDADAHREARAFARTAVWAVPIALAHLAVIYLILSAVIGFRLPAFLRSDAVLAWLWVNGAAVGLGVWSWKKGRVPVAAGKWMTGRRAKLAILAWLGLSLAWCLLPNLLGSLWRTVTGFSADW